MTTPGVQSTIDISHSFLYAGRDHRITNTHNHVENNFFSAGPPDPLVLLKQHAALGALHDAAERPDPPRCHEETRTAILDRIDLWARDNSVDAKPILWLSGAAGAGKSAIAQTLIERWRKDNLIVPNFFLWRTADRRNQKTHVMPTISFQLTQLLPATRPVIEEAVRDGSIFERNLTAQVEALISHPLEVARPNSGLVVIVLDGLDECCSNIPRKTRKVLPVQDYDDQQQEVVVFPGQHYEGQQREILEAIAYTCQKVPSLRVLITSRPERQIRRSFAGQSLSTLSLMLSLNSERNTRADITLYLDCKFAEIRSECPGIDPSWPSRRQIDELVEKSSGQFIYPSTVIKYVAHPRRHPVTSLEEVLALRPVPDKQGRHPLAELDVLYALVLKTVAKDSLPIVMMLLGLMSYYPYSQGQTHLLNIINNVRQGYNTVCLEKCLFLLDGELSMHLTDLHSILSISRSADDGVMEVGFFHATLSEYLRDESRSGEFFIKKEDLDLQISLILVRHANIERPANPTIHRLLMPVLHLHLARYLPGTPPFTHVMKGLWTNLKDEIGEYNHISDSNIKTLGGADPTNQPRYFQGRVSRRMTYDVKAAMLNYLQKCNIPEIEPSKSRRRAVGAHLTYLMKLAQSEGYGDPTTEAKKSPARLLWSKKVH